MTQTTMTRRRCQQRVHVSKHLIVEPGRQAVAVEADARPTVAEHEEPDEGDSIGCEDGEGAIQPLERVAASGQPARDVPAARAEVGAVVDPWQVRSDHELPFVPP